MIQNYAFLEDPSRLIRATRFAARFHWPLEERTQQRYDSARENNYIDHVSHRALGHEIEQIAYEDDPLNIMKVFEKEGWLKVLHPHWAVAKVDSNGLAQLMKTRQQMNELGYSPDAAASVIYFLTSRMGDKDIADMRRAIPRKNLVEAWKDLEDNAKTLSKRSVGKKQQRRPGLGSFCRTSVQRWFCSWPSRRGSKQWRRRSRISSPSGAWYSRKCHCQK